MEFSEELIRITDVIVLIAMSVGSCILHSQSDLSMYENLPSLDEKARQF